MDVLAFAEAWVDAWNARDLDRILAHYAEKVVFVSPVAEKVVDAPGGVVRGKAALRAYFEAALPLAPNLHFEMKAVYSGPRTVAVRYRNDRGREVVETMVLDDAGRVVEARALYGK